MRCLVLLESGNQRMLAYVKLSMSKANTQEERESRKREGEGGRKCTWGPGHLPYLIDPIHNDMI